MTDTLLASDSTPRINTLLIKVIIQRLTMCFTNDTTRSFPISTASAGIGNQQDSYQTPTGWHSICQKIGAGEPSGMIFKARQPIGKIATVCHEPIATGEDIITSRILWLQGLEPGVNRGNDCDSRQRFIYIHGTHEEGLLGTPASKGCIRMANADIISLFEMVDKNTRVLIN